MQLYIGNKNYSSWSMRVWLVVKHFALDIELCQVRFDDFSATGHFKKTMSVLSPIAKVPTLIHNDLAVWDSLAICEYLAEVFPAHQLWPSQLKERTRARCISAEMHCGFNTIRQYCPMNIEADLTFIGRKLYHDLPALVDEIARIEQIWNERPHADGFLCGDFSIADAFYAPIVMRCVTYGLPMSEQSQQYMQTMLSHAAVQEWITHAQAEQDFVIIDEPYRQNRQQFLKQ